jgi:hypothetical protein
MDSDEAVGSAGVVDAGAMPWRMVWDLLVPGGDPRAPATGAMAPLGLHGVHVGARGDPTSTYHGVRHSRWVQVRQARTDRRRLAMIVWIGVRAPEFELHGSRAGRLVDVSVGCTTSGSPRPSPEPLRRVRSRRCPAIRRRGRSRDRGDRPCRSARVRRHPLSCSRLCSHSWGTHDSCRNGSSGHRTACRSERRTGAPRRVRGCCPPASG